MKKTLFELEPGDSPVLSGLRELPGKEGLVRNLLDMGFLPGTKLQILAKYPSQDKIIVKIGLVQLALRNIEAELLELEESK
ncbi:FeoA domain protein [Leptospira broomii serovar Hurstbridge str. 5399]|uniref:FeoA domain protein n=3 Tax=Leptospira TaxID=171 RepID=V6HAN9_9LEPT|nr:MULTISPECIES: FeoA family protein [Leptospira]EQA36521.1 FeoA domain protein [Leptospira inadai serovar Lyme str. 10]EQA46979.1 FeoA domain protein [Leptospira broomii serovar Hurstbridge str. 5399]PNV75720.1 ferrous iron transport protein A [Leptospira inadai serovar Lyme]